MSLKSLQDKLLFRLLDRKASGYSILKIASRFLSPKYPLFDRSLLNTYTAHVWQGLMNQAVIPININGIWPFWVYRQLSPNSPHFNAPGFPPLLVNSTHRNWTSLSYPNTLDMSFVDPKGLITPYPNGWSLDFLLANSQKIVTAAKLRSTSQSVHSNAPIVLTDYTLNELSFSTETFFKHSSHRDNLLHSRTSIKNNSSKTLKFSFLMAIRPYNPQGISPIDTISYLTSNCFIINHQIGLILDETPDNVVCLSYDDGDILQHFGDWEMILKSDCPKHLASCYAEYRLTLSPGETKVLSAKIPTAPRQKLLGLFQKSLSLNHSSFLLKRVQSMQKKSFDKEKTLLQKEWASILDPLVSVTLPNTKMDTLFQQNLMHFNSFFGQSTFSQGGFTYSTHSLYQNIAMIFTANRIQAYSISKKIMSYIQHRYSWRRYFLRGDFTLELMAFFILAVYDYYLFTQDKSTLKKLYPFLDYCISQLMSGPFHIKFPLLGFHSIMSYHLSNSSSTIDDSSVIQSLWSFAGIQAAVKIAFILQKEDKVLKFKQFEKKFRKYIHQLLSDISKRPLDIRQNHALSGSAGFIYGLLGDSPLHIFPNDSPLLKNVLSHIEKYHLINSIYYTDQGHSGFSPVQNCHLAQCYLKKNDSRALDIVDWLTTISSSSGTWPESIHPITNGGMMGEGHFSWATASYLSLIRQLLIREDGSTLILTPMLPTEWYRLPDMSLKLSLPTFFGTVQFSLTRDHSMFILDLSHSFHTKPEPISIHFHQPIDYMLIGHKKYRVGDKVASIPLDSKKVKFSLKYNS